MRVNTAKKNFTPRMALWLRAVFAAAFAVGFASCSNAGDTYVVNNIVQEKIYPVEVAELNLRTTPLLVWGDTAIETDWEVPLGFKRGNDDIPYIQFDSAAAKKMLGENYSVSKVTAATKKVEIANSLTSAKAVIDLERRKLTFDNYDAFFQSDLSKYWDMADIRDATFYMKIDSVSNFAGSPVTVDWGVLGLEMFIWKKDGGHYLALPLQTVNDVFLAKSYSIYCYNGKCLYKDRNDRFIDSKYFEVPATGTRSQAFADFCFAELCLNFGLNYGLQAIHGMENFSSFMEYFSGLEILGRLKSADQMTFAKAVKDTCEFYFGDGHSLYIENSFILGMDTEVAGTKISAFKKNYDANTDRYISVRNEKIGEDRLETPVWCCPCYEVSDDKKTVIVRFDVFIANFGSRESMLADADNFDWWSDYYAGRDRYNPSTDTITLIHAVNEQIKEADKKAAATPGEPKIENIVLDLSCNGGGALHAAAFVLAWMLGECNLDICNQISGAKSLAVYKADVNFDGAYDAGDTVKDKNLFCMISPLSFSCGNMVPAVLKASGRVTMLGASSSGGTCCVQNYSAADGTLFRMSSKYAMGVSKNGSFYDIDKGVEPHYYINRPENFYDKEKISAIVNDINEGKLGNL